MEDGSRPGRGNVRFWTHESPSMIGTLRRNMLPLVADCYMRKYMGLGDAA